uniref:Hfaza1C n=1 Tax=Hypoxylon fragiforme TaxID=63214 RepID=A0A7G6J4G4_9PEZI|nr:Hfaza1C [Hypoxylon fragiforme]
MEFEENHRIRMQHSVTTVASSSSSRSELHRTVNMSERQESPTNHIEDNLDPTMASENQDLPLPQSTTTLATSFAEAIDSKLKDPTEPDEKHPIHRGSEEKQPVNDQTSQETTPKVGSEKEEEEARDTPTQQGLNANRQADSHDSNDAEEKQVEYVTGIKLALVLAALTIVYFLIMLDNTILATATPFITDEFHSLLDVGWYSSAFQLASSALQPLGGKIYSKLNSKWAFLVYLVIFEVGSVVCGAATSSKMLIIGRGVAGIGGSGLMNGALIVLNSAVPPHRQPGLIGFTMGLGQLGIAFGPLIGGAFTEYVTWRWCFYLNLPIGGVVALAIIFIRIPDHIEKPSARDLLQNAVMDFDLPGFALFAPAAIMLFLALQYGGNQYAWNSREVIGLFCGAGVTFLIWLVWDWYQGDNAMVPYSMMRRRIVWAGCVCGLFMGGTIFVTAYYLPIYFQAILGVSPFMSGVYILPNILCQMVFGIVAGGSIQRIGYFTPPLLIGAALNAIGCGLLSLLTPYTPTGYWVGFQILMGVGRGLAMAIPFLAMQNTLPRNLIPPAMSTLVFLQNFGAAIMMVFGQTILTNSLVDLIPQDAPGVNPQLIINAGTTANALERAVGPALLPSVKWAYTHALQRVWWFSAGIATPAFLVGWCLGFVNIRNKKTSEVDSDNSAENLRV